MKTAFILLFMKKMMKHLKSGTKKSVSRQSVFSVLEKQIISGNTVQAHVVHALRFIMTVARNTAAEARIVR